MIERNKNFYSLEELKRARDCYEGYQDGEEVYYFVGTLRYACDEIERLKEELKYTVPVVEHNKTITKHIKEEEQLHSIIKEVREKLTFNKSYLKLYQRYVNINRETYDIVIKILDKENNNV